MCVIMGSALLYKPLNHKPAEAKESQLKSLLNTDIWLQRKYVIWALAIPVALFGYFVPYVHMVCTITVTMSMHYKVMTAKE